MTHACAIGYDWFYHYWTQARRDIIRTAIITKGLTPGLAEYTNNVGWQRPIGNNWNPVCNGGLSIGALAVGDFAGEAEIGGLEARGAIGDAVFELFVEFAEGIFGAAATAEIAGHHHTGEAHEAGGNPAGGDEGEDRGERGGLGAV
eukprot:gene16164-biopygen13632